MHTPRSEFPASSELPAKANRGLTSLVSVNLLVALAVAPESATEIIATQLRQRGIDCTAPRNPTRDFRRSIPHETAWILRCDEGSYEVRLVPRTGARIRKLPRSAGPEADCHCKN